MRAALFCIAAAALTLVMSCNSEDSGDSGHVRVAQASTCQLVRSGYGPAGRVPLHVEKAITGLEVPWALAFLPGGDWLLTERAGRIRLVQGGHLVEQPVATVNASAGGGERGLLGLALHPRFSENRLFYVYYTIQKSDGSLVNRVERYTLSTDHRSASPDRVILDDIPAGTIHDGGRIKFGPDGMLYVSTGDNRNPDNAQDATSLNGKILRVDPDGGVPEDNPHPGNPAFVLGLRNAEAFDWASQKLLIVADNGPTGELGLTGRDEISFASAGSNLGWPTITACETGAGLSNPILAFTDPAPPGGGVVYQGNAIPEFDGNFLVGMLGTGDGATQLHRFVFDSGSQTLVSHEAYLQGQFGRLREVVQGPDGALYVTTSNCDGRGDCPSDGDYVLKITHG
jgi:glucose/arabinose dehydrogenase